MKESSMRPKRANPINHPARQDKTKRPSKYNYMYMKDETVRIYQGFSRRLAELREKNGVSAREMSLSLGQGAGYINNIENSKNLPPMSMFFEICEYLDVTPFEFFDYSERNARLRTLLVEFDSLNAEEQNVIITVAKLMRKGRT